MALTLPDEVKPTRETPSVAETHNRNSGQRSITPSKPNICMAQCVNASSDEENDYVFDVHDVYVDELDECIGRGWTKPRTRLSSHCGSRIPQKRLSTTQYIYICIIINMWAVFKTIGATPSAFGGVLV